MAERSDLLRTNPESEAAHGAVHDHVVGREAGQGATAVQEVGVAVDLEATAKTRSQRADPQVLIARNQNLHQSHVLALDQDHDLVHMTKITGTKKTVMTETTMISWFSKNLFFCLRSCFFFS